MSVVGMGGGQVRGRFMGVTGLGAHALCSDVELVERARGGSQEAFDELARRHRAQVRRVVRARVSQPEDAADIEQETLIRAYLSVGELSSPRRFSNWLLTIARNACTDYRRRRGRDRCVSLDQLIRASEESQEWEIPDRNADPVHRVAERAMQSSLRKVIRSMSQASRQAYALRERDELSMEQIAQRISGTVGSAKSLLYRARRKIERELEPYLAA